MPGGLVEVAGEHGDLGQRPQGMLLASLLAPALVRLQRE